jgi:transposase-like protein
LSRRRSKPSGEGCCRPGAEDAARKLVYLALQNAVLQWTKTRNWTTALLAFKIHFGDRVPDGEN